VSTPATASAAPAFVPSPAPFTVDTAQAAPAATPPQPPAVDQSAIVDQVLRGAFITKNLGQTSEIRLNLVPETLGDVTVKLTVSGGSVDAHVVAQTSDVRDALVAGQQQLTRSLADAGLKLSSLTVDIGGGSFSGFAQQQQQQRSPGNGNRISAIASDDGDGDETALEAVPSFAPPRAAGPTVGELNYLV
jgi:flagellar hook-length control protein FliK